MPATNFGERTADCGTDNAPNTCEDNLQTNVFLDGEKHAHRCTEHDESDEDGSSHARESPADRVAAFSGRASVFTMGRNNCRVDVPKAEAAEEWAADNRSPVNRRFCESLKQSLCRQFVVVEQLLYLCRIERVQRTGRGCAERPDRVLQGGESTSGQDARLGVP